MLTNEAYEERYWGPLKEFRKLFQGGLKEELSTRASGIRSSIYGNTSVSANVFEALARHIQLALRISSNIEEISSVCAGNEKVIRSLDEEVGRLIGELHDDLRFLDRIVLESRDLLEDARRVLYQHRDRVSKSPENE